MEMEEIVPGFFWDPLTYNVYIKEEGPGRKFEAIGEALTREEVKHVAKIWNEHGIENCELREAV